MIKTLKKIIVPIVGILLFCFLCTVYAEVTDILNIQGISNVYPQENVFIIGVENAEGVTVNGYAASTLNSTVNLGSSSGVTFNVTVYNNSNVVFGYNVMKYVEGEGTYDNTAIEVTTTMQKKHEDWVVNPQDTLTFPVTFSYKKGATAQSGVLNSVIEFEFLPFDEIPENEDQTTVAGAMDRFLQILNTPEELALLDSYMDNVPSNDRNSTYISNVPGANATDIASIESLFAGNLHININGEQTDVKIMIKEEDIINAYSGKEMTIYMTTDPLTTRFGTAVVYRCVFANNNGVWIRSDEMETGTANICDYSTGFRWGTGSFNTDSWKAS